jgi:hypothetical protein
LAAGRVRDVTCAPSARSGKRTQPGEIEYFQISTDEGAFAMNTFVASMRRWFQWKLVFAALVPLLVNTAVAQISPLRGKLTQCANDTGILTRQSALGICRT